MGKWGVCGLSLGEQALPLASFGPLREALGTVVRVNIEEWKAILLINKS